MRSRRSRFEQFCRVAVFALLGWLIGTSVFPTTAHRIERSTAAAVSARLPDWTRAAGNVPLHTEFSVTPDSWIVDWLSALAHSGHLVTWSGRPPAMAISLEAVPDPRGGTRIDLSGPPGTSIVVRDDASVIDTVQVRRLGARILSPSVAGGVVATAGAQRFGAALPNRPSIRTVVVIGQASWEGKFIASALEERGWPVIARFSVAPNVTVAQGRGAAPLLDTSQVAAVVAVDTTIAAYADAVARFVRSGGGLVLAGPSSLVPAMAVLAPGSLGSRLRPAAEPQDTIALGSTGFYPVTDLKADGIALERRASNVSMAVRRVGAGRVLQLGYDDSWRWRMAGGAGSVAEHRQWWSRVIGSVAYAPATAVTPVSPPPDEQSAPLARMVERIGPARSGPPAGGPHGPLDRRIFLTLIMVLLLAEWTSRRLRGLR